MIMKVLKLVISVTLGCLLLMSCQNGESLQQYYITSAENSDFISVDLPASLLNLEEVEINEEERETFESIKKMNLLAFQLKDGNKDEYEAEKLKVKAILNQEKYQDLMKFSSGNIRATIKYLGDDDSIDELIIFGTDKERGFALVRVLGKEMKPENMSGLIQAIQSSEIDGNALGQLGGLLGR